MNEEAVTGEVISEEKKNVPVTRTRWLTLTLQSSMQVVPFANYLRFGPDGVRRFGPNVAEGHAVHPHTLNLHLSIKRIGNETLLEYKNFAMQHDKPFNLDGTNIWYGQHEAAHLRVLWVWDFYRLFSGMKIAVEVPPVQNESAWAEAVEALRNTRPGDRIIATVESRSGDILQVYPVDMPAFERQGV